MPGDDAHLRIMPAQWRNPVDFGRRSRHPEGVISRSATSYESRPIMVSRYLLAASLAFLAVSSAFADDKPSSEKSALAPGTNLPASFRPFHVVNGKFEGRFHCPVCEHGLNPGVLIFANNAKLDGGPLVSLLKQLDTYGIERPKSRLRSFAIFLYDDVKNAVTSDDERDVHAAELKKAKEQHGILQTVLAIDSVDRLKECGYELDPKADLVVVLYDRVNVHRVYNFTAEKKLTDEAVRAIMTDVKVRLAPFEGGGWFWRIYAAVKEQSQ
jgi:hypothetical protein